MKTFLQILFIANLVLFSCGSDENESGSPVNNLTPSMSASVSSISFDNTMVTTSSVSELFILSTENILSEVSIDAPSGYSVSIDNQYFDSSVSFIPEITNQIYVRFEPSDATSYYSTLVISSSEINSNINILYKILLEFILNIYRFNLLI